MIPNCLPVIHVDQGQKILKKWKILSTYVQIEDELFGEDWLDSYATTILDAKYEKADILEVVNNQK